MSAHTTPKSRCSPALSDILICYLQFSEHLISPGADGLTLDDAINLYPKAMASGDVPHEAELRRLHPELADDIAVFFAEM